MQNKHLMNYQPGDKVFVSGIEVLITQRDIHVSGDMPMVIKYEGIKVDMKGRHIIKFDHDDIDKSWLVKISEQTNDLINI